MYYAFEQETSLNNGLTEKKKSHGPPTSFGGSEMWLWELRYSSNYIVIFYQFHHKEFCMKYRVKKEDQTT